MEIPYKNDDLTLEIESNNDKDYPYPENTHFYCYLIDLNNKKYFTKSKYTFSEIYYYHEKFFGRDPFIQNQIQDSNNAIPF